jgi:MYXO-CTERM domain-containing protein
VNSNPTVESFGVGVGFDAPVWGLTESFDGIPPFPVGTDYLQFLNAAYAAMWEQSTVTDPPYLDMSFFGPQLYTGSETNPTFAPGVFYGSDNYGTPVTITVTDAPEPPVWGLMLVGLGGLGLWRRSRQLRPNI